MNKVVAFVAHPEGGAVVKLRSVPAPGSFLDAVEVLLGNLPTRRCVVQEVKKSGAVRGITHEVRLCTQPR